MLSPIGTRGSSEEKGSWKMIWISLRIFLSWGGLRLKMFFPSKRTSPPVAGISRRRVRPTVVLPQPDSPTRPNVSPRLMKKLTSSTAFTWATVRCKSPPRTGKYLRRRSTSRSTSPFVPGPRPFVRSCGAAAVAVAVDASSLSSDPSAPGSVGVGSPLSAGASSDWVLCWSLIGECSSFLVRWWLQAKAYGLRSWYFATTASKPRLRLLLAASWWTLMLRWKPSGLRRGNRPPMSRAVAACRSRPVPHRRRASSGRCASLRG
jgi:hypothetical protein